MTFQEKEYCKGTWNNRDIRFNRVYKDHRFTDEECEALLDGKEITITGLISKKNGREYGERGCLADLVYDDHPYVGFARTEFVNYGIPNKFASHVFTPDEVRILESGEELFLDDCISKKGTTFSVYVQYKEDEDGLMRVVPDFDKR